MGRTTRHLRKTLDLIADNNESATLDLMRAAEQLKDQGLRERLLAVIHLLNQDAEALRRAARSDWSQVPQG